MGRGHSKNLGKIPEVEITAVCGDPIEDGMALAETIGNSSIKVYSFSNFEKMLNESLLDALFICLPPFLHQGQLEAAAAKGIHVFIEKPIALAVERGKSMVDAVKKAGVISQVGFQNRFGTAVKELKQLIENGTAGIPTLFDARYDCNSLHPEWWRDHSRSGGQIFEQIIHTYDLTRHFLGEPDRVTAFKNNLCHQHYADYSVEDTSAATIRFQSGALANISGSNCAIPGEWNNTFVVVCQNLTAYFTNGNQAKFIFTNQESSVNKIIDSNIDVYVEEDKAFINAILGKGHELCDINEGYQSLRLVSAVVQSTEEDGSPVIL